MMEERYHATTQNRFYSDMSNVNKSILVARKVKRGGFVWFWWGNRMERYHWRDLVADGWIILGWISRRWDVGIWTGLGWSRIRTGGGRL